MCVRRNLNRYVYSIRADVYNTNRNLKRRYKLLIYKDTLSENVLQECTKKNSICIYQQFASSI